MYLYCTGCKGMCHCELASSFWQNHISQLKTVNGMSSTAELYQGGAEIQVVHCLAGTCHLSNEILVIPWSHLLS